MLLVWGARQMMYLSGWQTVTFFCHPISLYRIYCAVFCIMYCCALSQCVYVVNYFRSLFHEFGFQFAEIVFLSHSRFRMRYSSDEIIVENQYGCHNVVYAFLVNVACVECCRNALRKHVTTNNVNDLFKFSSVSHNVMMLLYLLQAKI